MTDETILLLTADASFSVLDDTPSTSGLTFNDQQVRINVLKEGAATVITFLDKNENTVAKFPIGSSEVWKSPRGNIYMINGPPSPHNQQSPTYVVRPSDSSDRKALEQLYTLASHNKDTQDNNKSTNGIISSMTPTPNNANNNHIDKSTTAPSNKNSSDFASRTDQGSADLYFHYYGMLQHQQNMLADYIRTGTYYAAIMENKADFEGKAVMDVGCGSGILSLFAAQAGARVVYAVEASDMAKFARLLAEANPSFGSKIKVLHGKVEEIDLPEKVDVLVSEPMGTLLLNERMIETYLYAKEKFLKPGGKLFPGIGRIHVSAFSDETLHVEVAYKASFWAQRDFYGVDITCLQPPAAAGYFAQVVVDQIPPNTLVSNCVSKTLDFNTCTCEELEEVEIPLSLQMVGPCIVHGIASWFDVLFDGSTSQRWLSTAPGLPITHWFQLRCVLEQPLVIQRAGESVTGSLRMVAHSRQSYDIYVTLRADPLVPGGPPQESSGKFDLKEPYYRQLLTGSSWYPTQADGTTEVAQPAPTPAGGEVTAPVMNGHY